MWKCFLVASAAERKQKNEKEPGGRGMASFWDEKGHCYDGPPKKVFSNMENSARPTSRKFVHI